MTLQDRLKDKKIILASGSPRRKDLLERINLTFTILHQDVEENWPEELIEGDIAKYLAKKKSLAYTDLKKDEIIITADTIVWHQGAILNKPEDSDDAVRMLRLLSGEIHKVYTGVCIRTTEKTISYFDKTSVQMNDFTEEEIQYYVQTYNPLDKAGSYGAQDWLGYIGIESIHGCYYNVMGLPIRRVYASLLALVAD